MINLEFMIAVLTIIQPPVFGFIFFSVSRAGVVQRNLFSFIRTSRKRLKGVKFFECAVYPRLINSVQYNIHTLSLCILFILYDVDLLFFFTEVTSFDSWSLIEAAIVIINVFLFGVGLWYDYIKNGFNWSY